MAEKPIRPAQRKSPHKRLFLFSLGLLLVGISPIIGVLPGPGGLILFPLGLMLCLKNSLWAKRRYVRFKGRWPKYGNWTDKAMRRPSAARRRHLRETESKQMESLPHDN